MSDNLLLREALAYEARVTEAHIEGYARLPKALVREALAATARLRGAALDVPLSPDLCRRALRDEARHLEALGRFAGFPASRRTILEAQVTRLRSLDEVSAASAYAGVRNLRVSLRSLERAA